jgi:hypothetical protein
VGAVIHDVEDDDVDKEEDDDIDFLPYCDEEAEGMSTEQRALVASFETVHEDAIRHQALAAEVQARTDAVSMKRAYVHFNLAAIPRGDGTTLDQAGRGTASWRRWSLRGTRYWRLRQGIGPSITPTWRRSSRWRWLTWRRMRRLRS